MCHYQNSLQDFYKKKKGRTTAIYVSDRSCHSCQHHRREHELPSLVRNLECPSGISTKDIYIFADMNNSQLMDRTKRN
jgi:hypothetical protein